MLKLNNITQYIEWFYWQYVYVAPVHGEFLVEGADDGKVDGAGPSYLFKECVTFLAK